MIKIKNIFLKKNNIKNFLNLQDKNFQKYKKNLIIKMQNIL
jgi:hypothetical protein